MEENSMLSAYFSREEGVSNIGNIVEAVAA